MLKNELLYPTAYKRFLEENGHRVRAEGTRKAYRLVLRGLQNQYPGKRVSEFREPELIALITKPPCAPGTQLSRRNVLIQFFQWAHGEGLIDRDPSVRLKRKIRPQNVGVRHHNWLNETGVTAVLAACDDGTDIGRRDRVILATAFTTGLRRAELAAIRWGNLDLNQGQLRLVGKGNKPAELGFPSNLAELLFEWRGRCAIGLGRPVTTADPVFPRARTLATRENGAWHFTGNDPVMIWSEPLGHNGIYSVVRHRGEQAGYPSLRPHDSRRTFAGMMEEQTDILTTSKALRHSNIGTTQTYLDKNPRKHIEAGRDFSIAL